MKSYIGTKIINAKPMNRLEYNQFRGWELPKDENGADEGYLVEYDDGGHGNTSEYKGYVSWSPKDVFDRAYNCSGEMTFGDALLKLKYGYKVCRSGWNGKGMFLFVASGDRESVAQIAPGHDNYTSQPYIAMKTAKNTVVPWLCSQDDVLAGDWSVVDVESNH